MGGPDSKRFIATCEMIDTDGYRANVGIVLCNTTGQVMWARRIGQDAWQFPQGGISANENPRDAMYRELWEETGLEASNVSLLAATDSWLRYKLPKRLMRSSEPRTLTISIGSENSDVTPQSKAFFANSDGKTN